MTPRVLVVEDEEAISTLLSYNLEKQGYMVETAADGEEALLRVDENMPDLVLLDWMLPKVPVIEVCRRLRGRVCAGSAGVGLFAFKRRWGWLDDWLCQSLLASLTPFETAPLKLKREPGLSPPMLTYPRRRTNVLVQTFDGMLDRVDAYQRLVRVRLASENDDLCALRQCWR